jgi:hypothetical protein
MSSGVELAVYETFEEIFRRKSSLDELETEIKQFSLSSLLWVCATVVTGAQLWDRNDPPLDVYADLLKLFFPPRLVARFQIGFWSRNPRREVFHRRQVLLIAKLGILHCTETGIDLRRSSEHFGSILLKANDQFHHGLLPGPGEKIPDKEKFVRTMADIVAVTEYGKPNIGHALARNHLLLTHYVGQLKADADYIDVAQEFEAAVGFSIEENTSMLFGLHARFGRGLVKTMRTDPGALAFNVQTFFQTSIPTSKRLKFLSTVSATPAMMKRNLLRQDYGSNDFTIFRKFPAIEQWYNAHLKSFWIGYLLMDNHMLIEKQVGGPYWRALAKHGQRFVRFWGKIFEKYVDDLLANSCAGTPARFVPDVRDPKEPNRQICDGLVIDGELLAIIETKAPIFTADAKYSGNCTVLAEEIDSKMIRDRDTGKKKAAIQLADAATTLTADPGVLQSVGIDLSRISKIYPLVVTLDSIGGTVGISAYLNLAFQEALTVAPAYQRKIQPLGCVDIEGLEYMTEHFQAASLPTLLERWHEFNPALFVPFVATPLDGIVMKLNPWLKRELDDRFKSAIRILFPDRDPEQALKETEQIARRMEASGFGS